jgi:hypothetical protein
MGRIMSGWKPDIDLARLLDALAAEIVAAADEEVYAACGKDGRSVAAAASEVRALIAPSLDDDPGESDAGALPAEAVLGECRARQH